MRIAGPLLIAGALAGCTSAPPPPSQEEVFYVREGMVNGINPPMEAIWNLQVEVMDDYGNFDPDLMTADHWAMLNDAARQLEGAALIQSHANTYVATAPGSTLPPAPVGTDLEAIQARLEANPEAYNAFAQALAAHTTQLREAVDARDTETITQLVNNAQPVCKACHDVFWYPEEYQQ
ncbi:cytochrome c [Aurantiacibacter hainanensis]|uniref:cytochrome c n=1 Tax=Aurantiacibacter hainanensis TaxID=3076114 RepID=UPI0030C6CCFA